MTAQELCLLCRLEDAIAAKQDDIARLQAKQAMSQKALDLSTVQVTELKGALKDQAESLQASELAREALKVRASNAIILVTTHNSGSCNAVRLTAVRRVNGGTSKGRRVLQAEKAKLEGDLAVLQGKIDTREGQLQDTVRQLNISKFMLSESDEARDEVGTGMTASINSMHVLWLD